MDIPKSVADSKDSARTLHKTLLGKQSFIGFCSENHLVGCGTTFRVSLVTRSCLVSNSLMMPTARRISIHDIYIIEAVGDTINILAGVSARILYIFYIIEAVGVYTIYNTYLLESGSGSSIFSIF